jgi:hypothetical protein
MRVKRSNSLREIIAPATWGKAEEAPNPVGEIIIND